ncbi:MAG: TIGR00341 family protein [Bacteroidia bacterium]
MADSQKNFSLISLLKYRFNLDEDRADEVQIIESIKKSIEFRGANLWTLMFAIFIASIGLNVNSTAVIIGAMLISPLMGPIMGIGLGLGIFDFRLIKRALKNLLVAVTIGLITSTVYFAVTPLHEAQSELLARTTPTIWDVLIAFAGGLAGIVASSRKNTSTVIPGVAIATALMPPLCTAGYGLGTGNFYYFIGAFYLFLINCVFISISTFIIVRFLKFQSAHYVDKQTETKVRKYIWGIAILTILPSVLLAYRFVQEEFFKQKTQKFINNEIKAKNLFVIDQTLNAGKKTLKLVIYGEKCTDSLAKEIISRKKNYGLEKSDITIERTLNTDEKPFPSTEFKASENIELERQLIQREEKITALTLQLKQHEQAASVDTSIYKEFAALFGKPKELVITKTQLMNDKFKNDTITFLYYDMDRRAKRIDQTQLKNWLKERTKASNIKIIGR